MACERMFAHTYTRTMNGGQFLNYLSINEMTISNEKKNIYKFIDSNTKPFISVIIYGGKVASTAKNRSIIHGIHIRWQII